MARIMIVVDHKWRDLPNCVYLKLHLEKKYNHIIELVRLGEDSALMSSFRPHMIIYNNLYEKNRNAYARYLKEHGIKIVILPTEGITFSDQQTTLFTHKYSGIEFIDLYLAWNKLMFEAIIEHKVLPEDKVCLIGNSRFDFYAQPLSKILKGREYFRKKYGIPVDNVNLLLTTNFANAEHWPDTSFLENNLTEQRANGIPVFSDAGKLARYEFDYRNKIFDFIKEFCRQGQDVNLLLKYHPSERTVVYHKFVEELKTLNKNIFLIEGEYIWDVINVSDFVLQRCSTVAIESWFLEKHTIELELMPSMDHFLQPRYREGSWCINSVEQLLDKISQNDFCPSAEINKARKRILDHVAFLPDGKTTQRIAAKINDLIAEGVGEPAQIGSFTLKNKVKSIVRSTLGMNGYDKFKSLSRLKFGDYLGRYDKTFSDKDVKEWTMTLIPFVQTKAE